MTLQTITVVADVPEDQTTAAEAAAASFVSELPGNVTGAVVVTATFGGDSLLPTAEERFQAARARFDELAASGSTVKSADLKAALAELDDATAAKEHELEAAEAAQAAQPAPPTAYTPPPVPPAADPVVVDQATVDATAPAPTGEEPAPAPADTSGQAATPTGEDQAAA